MYLKLLKKDCYIHKLEHPTMHHQKSGKISHMIISLIFGQSGVLFMKWQHSYPPLELKIWRGFLRKSLKDNMKGSQVTIHEIFKK